MSASGSALAQLKPFTLNSRSLFVKCVPAPTTFYERRAVLAALQQTSQRSIEMFKRLQDISSFIAITTRPEAASTLLENSPLQRTVISQDPSAESASSLDQDVSGSIATPINPLPTNDAIKPTPASVDLGLSHKTFTLHIFPTNPSYNHREEVKKNPLHGPWPGNGTTESFVSAALRRVVPSGAMARSLRDWETGDPLGYGSDGFTDNAREGAASKLLGKKRYSAQEVFFLERIRSRRAKQTTPAVMSSPVAFAKQCRTESAGPQSEPSPSTATKPVQTEAEPQNHDSITTEKTEPLLDDIAFKKSSGE